jgi:hypothetical protein
MSIAHALAAAAQRARITSRSVEGQPARLRAITVADIEALWAILDDLPVSKQRVGPPVSVERRQAVERYLRSLRADGPGPTRR